jgi:hypothetical protein
MTVQTDYMTVQADCLRNRFTLLRTAFVEEPWRRRARWWRRVGPEYRWGCGHRRWNHSSRHTLATLSMKARRTWTGAPVRFGKRMDGRQRKISPVILLASGSSQDFHAAF